MLPPVLARHLKGAGSVLAPLATPRCRLTCCPVCCHGAGTNGLADLQAKKQGAGAGRGSPSPAPHTTSRGSGGADSNSQVGNKAMPWRLRELGAPGQTGAGGSADEPPDQPWRTTRLGVLNGRKRRGISAGDQDHQRGTPPREVIRDGEHARGQRRHRVGLLPRRREAA